MSSIRFSDRGRFVDPSASLRSAPPSAIACRGPRSVAGRRRMPSKNAAEIIWRSRLRPSRVLARTPDLSSPAPEGGSRRSLFKLFSGWCLFSPAPEGVQPKVASRKGTNGVSTNGVFADSISFFTQGPFGCSRVPLAYFCLPKSARAYFFPQSVKFNHFCSGPISVDPIYPQPNFEGAFQVICDVSVSTLAGASDFQSWQHGIAKMRRIDRARTCSNVLQGEPLV